MYHITQLVHRRSPGSVCRCARIALRAGQAAEILIAAARPLTAAGEAPERGMKIDFPPLIKRKMQKTTAMGSDMITMLFIICYGFGSSSAQHFRNTRRAREQLRTPRVLEGT
jgi:hypothetical protein